MRRLWGMSPGFWLANMVVALFFAAAVWISGAFSGGFDIAETCAARGQTYDHGYRSQNWEEPSRYFPLHNKCNAHYDMVPFWVNPAVVLLVLLAAIFAAFSLTQALTSRLERKKREHER
jgi:hypothetical protein